MEGRATPGPLLTIEQRTGLRPDEISALRDQIAKLPGATMSHDPAWGEVFRRALGHQGIELIARRGNQVVGWLPLAYLKSLLFGRFLVSLPYLNSGGPIGEDEEVITSLIDHAVQLANERNVRYLELRNACEIDHAALPATLKSKVLMCKRLPESEEALFGTYRPEVRNQIRKGRQNDLRVTWGREDQLSAFYEVFSANMRDLGTPVYPRKLFAEILKQLSMSSEICVVHHRDTAIAAALLLHGQGRTEVPSASSLRSHNKTCANMLMYHHLLARSVERGQTCFDFGRSSPDSGTYRFKKQWGAEPEPSVWQYYCRRGDITDMRPTNPKYQSRIAIWKKLPVGITKWIGPLIVRGIP